MAMLTRYVLMTFGAEDFRYWQAHYAVLGLLAWAPRPCEIVMATDHPERFRWFGDALRIHALTPEQVRGDWIGPSGYFLRTLIKTCELGFRLAPAADVVVYTDTDTVARADLAPLVDAAAARRIELDRREYRLATRGRSGSKALWEQVRERDWAGVRVSETTDMWNTGVTALGRADAPLIDRALAATDAMLAAGIRHYLTEQIAMSAVLTADGRADEVNPPSRAPLILHYWGNKDGWNAAIAGHLATIHHRGLSVAEAAAFVRDHPITLPPVVKIRWWHRLLHVAPVRTGPGNHP